MYRHKSYYPKNGAMKEVGIHWARLKPTLTKCVSMSAQ